jgi:hypothetical protein
VWCLAVLFTCTVLVPTPASSSIPEIDLVARFTDPLSQDHTHLSELLSNGESSAVIEQLRKTRLVAYTSSVNRRPEGGLISVGVVPEGDEVRKRLVSDSSP